MPRITIFGSVGEVGGNQILFESDGSRVLLDFGTRMGFEGNFFAEFLDTRTSTALKDRITIGALPKIPGIYWENQIRPARVEQLSSTKYKRILPGDSPYLEMDEPETYEKHLERTGKPFIDALFVSHAHMDHAGAIEYLHPKIPLYCTRDTKIFLETIDEITAFKLNALKSKERLVEFNGGKSTFPGSPRIGNAPVQRVCRILEDGSLVKLDDVTVKLIEVDHSVPGAASFVVEANGKRILYSGDIRFHGTKPMTTEEYVAKVGGNIDVMVSEGTRILSTRRLTEKDVCDKIAGQMSDAKGLVFVDFSWKDTTRFETVHDASRKSGRTFVINGRLAIILRRLGTDVSKMEDVKVFLKRRGSALYSPGDYSHCLHEYGYTTNSEKEGGVDSSHYDNGLVADDIRAHPKKYVMMLSYYDMGQIFDIADASGKLPGSFYIKAQCEPFSDEMEIDEERLINWLDRFGIGYTAAETSLPDGCSNPDCGKLRVRLDRSHVSGHASRPELKELISMVRPKVLVPIHSENPEMFAQMLREIEEEGGPRIELRLPVYGKTIEF